METADIESRALDAAERLFYEHGVQAVGMDRVRAASGLSLKRLYQHFPSKEAMVEAYLRRRDRRWRAALAEHVAQRPAGRDRALAVFDWLHAWFGEPDFRGCAFLNAFGEMGTGSAAVAEAVREHKAEVRDLLLRLALDTGTENPDLLADQLAVLVDGAIVTAAVTGTPAAAHRARAAAEALIPVAERP
ncbi:TetR/AcrR family transcriptional regulator [Streptomyces sp. UNOC14_S4]|uniref:TetR/AcrR family transcriptional regulator n=1 Tax=Streptomyces sp. UNOC14_S4 TaxID=2872340 RepID=UPI001E4B5F7F|nr:TetR/AcrR family transcriptional regulator [Streptomyces sp. UNOC14_S4]MCC3769100.1 TetR/AcrR family transcriptional regulator [Streptomyces sp. UNOC14_S4]